ncbi:MAG: M48 family metallopeptidase [Halanaerobiaceae bacterium]
MESVESLFDSERRELAEEYNKKKKWNNKIGIFFNILFWLMFFLFSFETKLLAMINDIFSRGEFIILLYIFSFYFIYSLFQVILDYYLGYKLSRKYDLSSQDSSEWFVDQVKSFILGLIFFYLAVRTYLYLANNYPQYWWVYFSIVATIFVLVITFIFPTVLLPIFFKLESYPESELKDRLMNLIKKTGLEIDDIYEINLSTKINAANAAVMGLGSTRKVVLGDRLKEKYSYDEIEAVLAHELGHQVHGDIFKNLLIQPVGFLIISFIISQLWPAIASWFGYQGITGVHTIPLLMILAGFLSWVLTPLQLYLSRKFEKAADLYAIEITDKAEKLASAMAKLADEALAPLEVSKYKRIFKLSHPPMKERVEYILENS